MAKPEFEKRGIWYVIVIGTFFAVCAFVISIIAHDSPIEEDDVVVILLWTFGIGIVACWDASTDLTPAGEEAKEEYEREEKERIAKERETERKHNLAEHAEQERRNEALRREREESDLSSNHSKADRKLEKMESDAVKKTMDDKAIVGATKSLRVLVFKLDDESRPGSNVNLQTINEWEKEKFWEDPLSYFEWCKRQSCIPSIRSIEKYTDYLEQYESLVENFSLSRLIGEGYRRLSHDFTPLRDALNEAKRNQEKL